MGCTNKQEFNDKIHSIEAYLQEDGKLIFGIDGQNVLYTNKKNGVKCERLLAVYKKLIESPCEVFILLPEFFEKKFANNMIFQDLVDQNLVFYIPNGEDDDPFILEFAKRKNAFIISNDGFKEYQTQYFTIIKEKILKFMIIERENSFECLIPHFPQNNQHNK